MQLLSRLEASPALAASFVVGSAALFAVAARRHRGCACGRTRALVTAALTAASVASIAVMTLVPVTGGGSAVVLEPLHSFGTTAEAATFLGNVLLFVPLGIAVGLLHPGRRVLLPLAVGALLSAGVEVTQHYASLGRISDADDVLANTAGTLLGWGAVVWRARTRS